MRSASEVRFWSPVEVADRYRVKKATVWGWLRAGKLPAKRIAGGRYYITDEDLKAFEAKYANT